MSSRIGYRCTDVSPSGDDGAARLLDMRGPTSAALARPGGGGTAARLEAVIAESLDTLDRQVATVAALPRLERLFRNQSNFHHHWIFTCGEWLGPDDPRIATIRDSWRGVRPLAHMSVSRENVIVDPDPDALPDFAALEAAGHKASRLRGHSDRMWNRAANEFVAGHLGWCDVEVEAKAKNLASRDLADHVRAAGIA